MITKSRKPFGHGPHLQVSIPANVTSKNEANDYKQKNTKHDVHASKTEENEPVVDLTISYKDHVQIFAIKNPYVPKNFPRSNIVKICNNMYQQMSANKNSNSSAV